MKKLIFFACFIALSLASCSSSSDSSPATESDVLLKKSVETYANDGSTVTTNYTYNGKKLIESLDSDGYKEVITYTGDLITNMKSYDVTNTVESEDFLTYNSSNQLTNYVLKNYVNDMGRKEVFVYNSDGTVSFSVYNGDNTTQTNLVETGTIIFTNGEVTRINLAHNSGISYTASHIYTYDTKNNPFKNVTGYDKLNFINEEAFGITHNILTDVYTSTLSTNDTYNTTYTYNSLNYPLTSEDTKVGDPTSTISTVYTYN